MEKESFTIRARSSNTLTESEALVRNASAEGISALYVVAPPFHQLRAVMTSASEAIRHERLTGELIGLFGYTGIELPWEEVALHSQGKDKGTREELIFGEMRRIRNYTAEGDILTVREINEYLDRRTAQR